jgi:bacterioferritin
MEVPLTLSTRRCMTKDESAVCLLNGALASEIVCVLRYQRHHFMATGIHANAVAREFLTYANEEQRHADLIATRITQLDGKPMFSPDGLFTSNHAEYAERKDLIEMVRENLVAERIGIEAYGEMIRYFGDDDPTSRRLLEDILVNEKEHAGNLRALVDILRHEERIRPRSNRQKGSRRLDSGNDAKW